VELTIGNTKKMLTNLYLKFHVLILSNHFVDFEGRLDYVSYNLEINLVYNFIHLTKF